MHSFFSAKSSANRQPHYEEYDDDDDDDQYESTDGSISSYEDSDSGSDSRFPPRGPSRQDSRQLGPAGISSSRPQMLGPAPAEQRSSYASMGRQAPPQLTRSPASHALQQPVPEWGVREPTQRYQNSGVASGFDNSQIRSSISTKSDRNPFVAEPILPNHRSVAERNFSIPRKPVNKPGKRILIAVFGMTGTGKTSFIKTLAGEAASRLRTGHDLESCTQEIETVDFPLDGHDVTLVDTPGFDDSKRSDTEILTLIADWLAGSDKGDTLLSGIIYLHRISDVRMSGSSFKNLRMFRKLCGTENMSKVCLLTTMWDKVTPQDGSAKETELKGQGFWGSMIAGGCSIRRHDRGINSARDVVRSMLVNEPTTIKLQKELFSGKELIDTDAGVFINEEILKLQKQHEEELNGLKEEMGSEMAQSNRKLQAQLEAEYAKIVSEMKQREKQREKLAQTRIIDFERRLQDVTNKNQKYESELRVSAAKERELRIIAERDREQAEQALKRSSSARQRELRMAAARERDEFEQEARGRERFGPVRDRGGYEEHPHRREAEGDPGRPNIVKARRNSAPEPYQGPTWSETKRKRDNHNGRPYKTFQCYVPKTFGSSGCGRPFDVVNPMPGKVQCCYCRKNWTIWGQGRLR
ncbi:putative G domain-containing protein [Seiridium cardinale]|uniref:G domain-containing protein n=1 Tax=Seiridium cardinale TaxID=138064 RepID=A0ABR2XMP4_9PEZI